MNNREFSDNFDVLLNSYDSKAPFGDEASKQEISLNEYEKSVFLSMAEEDVVKSYFDKTLNQQAQGFDDTARRQIEYSSLIKVVDLKPLISPENVVDKNNSEPGMRFMAAPILRAANTEQIIINDPQWGAGKAALSANSILLTPAAQSVLVGYKNPKQGYKIFYSDNSDWLTITDTEVDGKPYFRISVTENTTGAQRVGKFWLEYYARDYEGDLHQFLGISVNVIQVVDDGSIVTIQIPDDSDILPLAEYYSAGYSYSPTPFVSTTEMAAIEYTGGRKFIPITFSDGTTFLQRLEAGDVTIIDEWATGPTAGPHWCWITPAEGGLIVECEESSQNSWLQTANTANPIEWPKYREHVIQISFANVLNASTVDYTINQRSVPLGVSGVDPYVIPFRIGHSTMFAFDAEGGEQSETISSTTGTFTITQNNVSEYPDWLTVSISADYKEITYICTPNNTGETRKFWASYTAHKDGSDETATFGTFIEQYYSNEHPDLGLSANPKEFTFSAIYDAGNVEREQSVLTIPDGYGFGYRKEGDFFTVTHNGRWLIAKLASTNDTGAVKKGTITVYLTDSSGKDVGAKSITIDVKQYSQVSTDNKMLSCNPGPSNGEFYFGFNGAERAFTKFWYVGGEVSFTFDYDKQPTWFRLKKADKYVNTDQSNSKVNYNPFGYYVECDANTTGELRRGTIFAKLQSYAGGQTDTSAIYVNQAGGPDLDKPSPVIICNSPITVPASGELENGAVSIFFPITFTDVDKYEIKLPTNSFIKSYSECDGGIMIVCSRNEGLERDTSFDIVAKNEYITSTQRVEVTQQSASEQTPVEPDLYLKANRTDIVIKSTDPQTEIIKINTNCNSVYTYIEAENNTDNPLYDDWAYEHDDEIDPIILGNNEFAFDFDDNLTGEERTCTITFSNIEHGMEMDEDVVVSDIVTIKQLIVPEVSLAYDTTNISWEGGRVSVPISIVGLQYKDLKVSKIGAAASATIDVNGNLVVEISRNNHDYTLEHEIEIEGSNQLDEKATATLTISQGVKPVYTGEGDGDDGDNTVPSGDESSSGGGENYSDLSYTINQYDERSYVFRLPRRTIGNKEIQGTTDVLYILQEKLLVKTENNTLQSSYIIKPLSYLEYDRIMSKVYSYPMRRQAWRIFQNQSTGFDIVSEIIPSNSVGQKIESAVYRIRYVRRPKPIILEDLPDGLQIDGYTKETTCEINPILHQDILIRAVQLALTSKGRQTNSTEKQ